MGDNASKDSDGGSRVVFIRCLGFTCVVLLLVAAACSQESYDQLLHHWDYDKNAPLNIQQAGIEERGGVTIYDISFSSPVSDRSTSVGPNGGTVTAYLIVPPGQGRFPAVIFGHWCMPGSEKKNRTAIVLAHSGVISLLPDHVIVHPGFVEDRTPLNEQQIAVEVQQDVSLRRGADLLPARTDVDPRRLAYVGHSCDGSAGGLLSGTEKRFKAFVIMAGDLSFDIDKKPKSFQEYRQKIGPAKFDTFAAKYSWMDAGKYVSHAAPAAMFLQYATDELFLNGDLAKQYFELVSEPKKLKIYSAPHALNLEATRDRITFLAALLQGSGRQDRGRYPGSRSAAVAEASPIDGSARRTATNEFGITEDAATILTFAKNSTEIWLRSNKCRAANCQYGLPAVSNGAIWSLAD